MRALGTFWTLEHKVTALSTSFWKWGKGKKIKCQSLFFYLYIRYATLPYITFGTLPCRTLPSLRYPAVHLCHPSLHPADSTPVVTQLPQFLCRTPCSNTTERLHNGDGAWKDTHIRTISEQYQNKWKDNDVLRQTSIMEDVVAHTTLHY